MGIKLDEIKDPAVRARYEEALSLGVDQKRLKQISLPPPLSKRIRQSGKALEPAKREKALHAEILAYCRSNGWMVLHGSMAQATGRTLGEPDFTVLLPKGRIIFVEAKTSHGKLSIAQEAFAARAGFLGHVVHVCRSVTDFRNVVNFGVV